MALWQQISSLEDPRVGIREDFRRVERKQREMEAQLTESESLRQRVADGNLRCARCDRPFTTQDGHSRVSFIHTHQPEGECGKVPFCLECELAVRGWNGEYAADADSWSLDEECPTCQPILAEYEEQLQTAGSRRIVSMPEPYGRRLVQEPKQRMQGYIVGDQTVSRSELQSVLMMFKYIVLRFATADSDASLLVSKVDDILDAVRHPNNIHDWDWLEGIGESYVPDHSTGHLFRGDRFLYPKRWWSELPPCPLTIV